MHGTPRSFCSGLACLPPLCSDLRPLTQTALPSRPPLHQNNFERNQLDTFIIKGPDVGDPDRIKLRSDNSGVGPAWHLQHVDIVSSATNQTYHFPYDKCA